MEKRGRILVIDDKQDILFSLKFLLKQHFKSVFTESNPYRLEQILPQYEPNVILLDMNFGPGRDDGREGLSWLKKIREWRPLTPVITMTAYSDVDIAVKALKTGATDFIEKPWRNEKLIATLRTAIDLSHTHRALQDLKDSQRQLSQAIDEPYHEIVGKSAAMQSIYMTIAKVAQTDAHVLITGENGVGKELVARAVHRKSRRQHAVFLPVDLGTVPDIEFDDTLFGATNVIQGGEALSRRGRMGAADGGTLFLKGIESLTVHTQGRFLEGIKRLDAPAADSAPEGADIRLICAASGSLYDRVEQGLFRQDLLYCINTVEMTIPPLRYRKVDIPILAGLFLERFARKYHKPGIRMNARAIAALEDYDWPGNVTELRHIIERAVIMSDGPVLSEKDLVFRKTEPHFTETMKLEDMERQLIHAALEKHNSNISRAARDLGISRASLYRRMDKFGMS